MGIAIGSIIEEKNYFFLPESSYHGCFCLSREGKFYSHSEDQVFGI